jgi:hypothetical protein
MELKSRSFTSKEPHVAHEPQVADPWSRALRKLGQTIRLKSGTTDTASCTFHISDSNDIKWCMGQMEKTTRGPI